MRSIFPFRRAVRFSGLLTALLALTMQAPVTESRSESRVSPPTALELHYHVRLLRPTTHLVEIEIVASTVTAPALEFVMPAWSPGRYAIYDFAKNVQEFAAVGGRGQALPWTKVDKQTWRVETAGAGSSVRVSYRVYANDLSGTFSQFDTSHANLNGASVYMYVAGHQSNPLTLTVDAPDTWEVISGFSPTLTQRTFPVPNYDVLIDTPMEISNECSLAQFAERGKTVRVAVHSYSEQDSDLSKLLEGLKKIVRSQLATMPDPDFRHYTFIFHFAPDIAMGDGMEHLSSTQIVIRGKLADAGLSEALELAAHEFFHLWNVKRLRPAGLGPFDYTREHYTRALWFAEGVTSYYAFVHLLRSGIWSREQFLKRLADEIRNLDYEPGRTLMSAESSSFHAWFYDRSPQMQETNFANATISYYNKGALLGMLLDLEIRARTRGQKSLDDVLRLMYRNFYEALAASYYGPGRAYEEEDILEAVKTVAGSDFTTFFDRYVRGTELLSYAPTLALAGLELRVAVSSDSAPSLGVLPQRANRGVKLAAVRPGKAADRAGLSRGDLLVAVDGRSVETEELRDLLKIYPPGAEVPFTIERHGRQERIFVTLDPPIPDHYSIGELPGAPPEQVMIRDAWLSSRN